MHELPCMHGKLYTVLIQCYRLAIDYTCIHVKGFFSKAVHVYIHAWVGKKFEWLSCIYINARLHACRI